MAALSESITIGELAARSDVATSALRFYEARGLIHGGRTAGGQRRYHRATLRRVAFIRAGQRVGLSLTAIGTALAELPDQRTPTKADWVRLSRSWQAHLDAKRAELDALQTRLTGCIGCGCLSLRTCALFNDRDIAADRGAGARYLLGDPAPDPDRPAGAEAGPNRARRAPGSGMPPRVQGPTPAPSLRRTRASARRAG